MGAPARNKLKTWAWLRPDCSWLLSFPSQFLGQKARTSLSGACFGQPVFFAVAVTRQLVIERDLSQYSTSSQVCDNGQLLLIAHFQWYDQIQPCCPGKGWRLYPTFHALCEYFRLQGA